MYVFSVHVCARYEMHRKMNRFIYVYNLILILLRFIDINLILIFSHDHNIYTVWNCSYTWFTCKFYLPVGLYAVFVFFFPREIQRARTKHLLRTMPLIPLVMMTFRTCYHGDHKWPIFSPRDLEDKFHHSF